MLQGTDEYTVRKQNGFFISEASDTKDNSTNAWKMKHWFVELIDGFEAYYTSWNWVKGFSKRSSIIIWFVQNTRWSIISEADCSQSYIYNTGKFQN